MASNTDVLIECKADISQLLKDLQNAEKALKQTQTTIENQLNPSTQSFGNKVTAAGSKVKQLGTTIKEKIGTEGALAFAAVGAAAMSFTKQCIDSAISAESAWTQMNALLSDSSSGTGMSIDDAKSKIKGYANEWGYTVGSVRAAGNALLMTGLDNDKLEMGLKATAAVAARTGKSFEDASTLVSRALAGNGRDFERLTGLRIADYKAADGQVDKERLLNDLYNQNTGAIQAHADTTEAALAQVTNSWNTLKADIGNALLPVVKIVGDVVKQIADAFHNLPEPAKQVIAAILLIVGAVSTVLGVLGFLAPIFIAAGEAIGFIGGIIGTVVGVFGTLASVIGALGVTGSIALLFEILQGAALLLLDALLPIAVPVLAIVAAFTALYLVGIQMGWWSDLTGMISKFGEVLGQVLGVIGNFVNWFILLFTDFPKAQQMFNDFISTVPGMVMSALSNLGSWIMDALGAAWDALTSAGQGLAEAVDKMFQDAIQWIITSATDFANNIIQTISDALTDLGNMVIPGGGLVAGILSIFAPIPMAIAGLILNFGPTVWNAITTFVGEVTNQFMTELSGIGESILSTLNNIPGWISDAIGGFAASVIPAVTGFLGDVADSFLDLGSWILDALGLGIDQTIGGAAGIIQGFIDSVVQFFSDLPPRIVEVISNLPQMIGDALSGLGDMVIPGGGLVAGILSIFLPIPAAIVGLISNFAPEVIPAVTGFIGDVAGSFGDIGASILSAIGDGLTIVRNGILDFMGGIADTLSGLGNLPVIGPVFDGLAASVRVASDVFGIFASVAIGVVNVFSQLLSGTMSIGDAFNALGAIFGTAFNEVQAVIGTFIGNILAGFAGIGQQILQGFLNIPQALGQFFMLAVQQIQMRLTQARAIAGMLVSMLVQAVATRFNMLVARVRFIFLNIVNVIRARLASARAIAGNLANMIRNAIVTRFNLIVAKARSIFAKIASTIRQKLVDAVNAAKQKAQEILQGIKDKVSQIPQAVEDEFNKIKDKISTALDNAKNVAVQKISDLVAAVKSALGIASPGYIQRMTAGEFESIPMHIATQAVNAVREARNMASSIVDSWYSGMSSLVVPDVVNEMSSVPSDLVPDTILSNISNIKDNINDLFDDWSIPVVQLQDEWSSLPGIIESEGARAIRSVGNIASSLVRTWNDGFGDGLSVPLNSLGELTSIPLDYSGLYMSLDDMMSTARKLPNLNNSTSLPSLEGMNTTQGNITSKTVQNNTNTNNTTHVTHNHYDKIVIDLNKTSESEKERFYHLLETISPGGV